MSINWTVRDLAGALRQIRVAVEDVVVGDIVVDDFGVQQIARIQSANGRTALYDEDDNGGLHLPKQQVMIVDRAALAPRRKAASRAKKGS